MRIRLAELDDVDTVQTLFREYLVELDLDLDFQHVEQELAALPRPYARPHGAILLAVDDAPADERGTEPSDSDAAETLGMVAVKPLPDTDDGDRVCEMKRLYVRPKARGRGIGHNLAQAILETARDIGYDRMRLDTIASMHAARAVYQSLGFEERSAYYDNPLADVVYYERSL